MIVAQGINRPLVEFALAGEEQRELFGYTWLKSSDVGPRGGFRVKFGGGRNRGVWGFTPRKIRVYTYVS